MGARNNKESDWIRGIRVPCSRCARGPRLREQGGAAAYLHTLCLYNWSPQLIFYESMLMLMSHHKHAWFICISEEVKPVATRDLCHHHPLCSTARLPSAHHITSLSLLSLASLTANNYNKFAFLSEPEAWSLYFVGSFVSSVGMRIINFNTKGFDLYTDSKFEVPE